MYKKLLPLVCLCSLTFACGAPDAVEDRYLRVVRTFVETMMEKGTDHYGPVHSPLFAAMLDLDRMSLPVVPLPSQYYEGCRSGMCDAIGFGLPEPPCGIRPTDRSPAGNNLEHDLMLLRTMFELSRVTGEPKFAEHARQYLRFWLEKCQSPATGLMATGEHMCWDFVREKPHGNLYEFFRRFALYDEIYSIDPHRALRNADALWLSQIGNRKVGDFSRHAGWEQYAPDTGAAYPRHAGFYIWAYANAYVQSRDPKYIRRAEVLIESRTGRRLGETSLLVEPGAFEPEHSTDPTLRAALWEAAQLIPECRLRWEELVRELDEVAFRETASGNSTQKSAPPTDPGAAARYAGMGANGRRLVTSGGTRALSTTLSPVWEMSYGSCGLSGAALRDLTRYRQTGDRRFLEAALGTANLLLTEGLPQQREDLWPSVCGQVISLLLGLAKQPEIAPEKREHFESLAVSVADMAVGLFSKNGLFRADGNANHYEAITGADDLLWSLLQLHCQLNKTPRQLEHINTNW